MNCVSATQNTVSPVFTGYMEYDYQTSDGTTNIPSTCDQLYVDTFKARSSDFSSQSSQFTVVCKATHEIPDDTLFTFQFLPNETTGRLITGGGTNTNKVRMRYYYTMLSTNATYFRQCEDSIRNLIISGNYKLEGFTTRETTLNTGVICPPVAYLVNSATLTPGIYTCSQNYFRTESACVPCPSGSVRPVANSDTKCEQCQVGYYRDINMGICTACPTGMTTRYLGTTSSSQCIAACAQGSVSTTGYQPCYPCAKGSYSISTTTCTPCPTGNSTTSVGASSIADCSVSSYTALERCPLGTQQNYTVGDCIKCDYGTYGVLGIVNGVQEYVCTSCGSNRGTFIRGAVRIEQCYDVCQAGYVSRFAHGLAPCDACAVGTYYNTATRRCDSCPAGTSTLASASIGASACIQTTQIRDNCPLGSFRNQTIGSCEACPLGTYSTGEEQNACTQCPNDASTYMPGATSSAMCTLKCAPGFFSSNGLSPCTPCGLGQFSTAYGSTSCSSCSADQTTLSITAISCVRKCAAGRFSFSGNEGVTGSSCRACPQNYYQSSIGQTSCSQCPPDTSSQLNGLTNVSQCQAIDCTNRCVPWGTCIKQDNNFLCQCMRGYEGDTCQTLTDVCASSPCYNGGTCARNVDSTLGYICTCNARATGSRCETLIKTCNTSAAAPTCLNGGYCINRWQEPGYECMCPSGFSGARCNQTANICVTNPCSSAGTRTCMDSSNGQNLRRRCMCWPGYGGESCAADINECLSNPCINGGTCVDQVNGFQCVCKSSYTGVFCEGYINPCQSTTCSGQGSCVDIYRYGKHFCSCNAGYTGGNYVEYSLERDKAPVDINSYSTRWVTVADVHACRSQCTSRGSNCDRFTYRASGTRCYFWFPSDLPTFGTQVGYDTFTKHESQQTDDFWTMRYNVLAPSTFPVAESERLNDLTNLGLHICHGFAPIDVRCCPVGQDCTGKALDPTKCADVDRSNLVDGGNPGVRTANDPTNYDVQFKCSLNRVFLSNTCTQKNDYCKPDPCVRGQCQLTFAGYSCSCPSGYTGKNCQTDINECATNPCSNGGTCTDKVNGYLCACKPEYTGATCASQVNYCVGVSCSGNGTCMNRDQGPGYMCNCFQGYTGTNCESQINFCASQPCLHGSSCIPALNTYRCECLPGWTGRNCDTMINYCTGSLCQGACHPVFTTYYCACGANTYGANCQNRPTPCQTFNKCQNLGTCSYNTSSAIMACTCPAKYNGDGCEWLRDLCNTDNPCKNNADCSIIQDNYKCTCKPGYTGTNCETEINECSGRTCPGGGQCFDAVNAYYCRCPLKKTGNNCGREFDRNYDFYFNHPTGMGFAWIPYFIFVPNVDAMSVTGWVRYAAANGKGVYFNMFIGDRLETAKKFLEFNELGVKIHLPNGIIIQHELSRTVQVNDGNWHYITLNFNMVSKAMRLYLDTVYHQPEQTVDISSLKVNNNGFRMWVVLGCEFDNKDHICIGGADSFRGYVSQINIYKRELTFASSSGVAGEISYNFAVPRNIFEDNAQLTNVILVWNEYKFDSGVSRIIPSEAKGDRCSVPNRSPPCGYFSAMSRPSAQNCPKDFTVYAEDRIKTVTWVDPTFDNLGVAGKVHQGNDNLKGKAYTWGKYEVIYVGSDGSGNSAYCHFSFYVQPFRCNSPPDPFGGFQFSSNATDPLTGVVRHGRTIGCYNTNTPTVVNYKTDREHPKTFTCDPYGTWNNVKPFRKFRYPSCGAVKPKPQGKITLHLEYNLTTGACESVKVNLIQLLKQEVSKLDLIYQGDLCKMSDCSDIDVTITCSGFSAGRRKRQVVYARVLAVIKLGNIPTQTSLDGETLSVQDFFTYFALGAKVFDFSSTIANADILPQRFVIDSTLICPEYEVLLDGKCVECGLGNVYRYNNETGVAICEDCPLGQYQDNFKQKACKECPAGTTTEMTGEYQASMCKAICQVGHYFNNDLDKCMPCKIGYYQDLMGQFYCKWCGPSFTTENEGSTSDSQCSSQCESGYQLSGPNNCTPCLIGQYRNATESRVCMNCPTGKITAAIASRSADACSITACTSGNYRRSSDNTCQPCPLNYYQNETWQDQCKPCGNGNFSMWRTTSTGSSKEQDCLFYCPSGYEVSSTQAQTCVPCARDQYKDNSVDIQGLCTPCPNNLRATSIAATFTDKLHHLLTGCVLCALGSYQDVAESETCKMCPASRSTRTVGATAQSACENYCDSGYEKVGSACLLCAVGSYKDNTEGLFSNCTACDPLYTTPSTASTSRTACSIRTCPAGTYRNVGDTGCTDCDLGYYQPQQFQTSCLKCPDDTSTMQTKSTLATDCKAYCPNGKEMVNSVCQDCSRGYFRSQSDGLFAMCQMCPLDKITPSTGATTISQCIIANCSAGYRLKTDNTCEICPKGSYSESKWLTTCTPCGIHKTTEREGATNQSLCIVECEQGFEDASGACVPCQQGFYKDIKAAAQCKPCPVGYITSGSGATNLTMCNIPACSPGTFLNETASPAACQVCGYDTYQDTKWQKSCKSCSANLVTLQTGSTSLAQCVADCASGQEYSATNRVCRFCPIGFYRDRNDRLQPSCQMCDIRYITAGEGAKSVVECNIANCTVPGQYRNTLTVCTPCPVGEYSSEKWRTSCERCPDGYSTRGIGKTTLADCIRSCPLGEYVTLANTCEMCAKGTYRSDPSTESCIPCPDNLTTPTVGSRTRDACSISPCIAGQRYSQNRTCEACPIATYQPMAGMFNCLNCPANRNLTLALGAKAVEECKTACQAGEMWMWGTALCEKCPHGFYQPSAEQFTCMQCPAARGSTVSPSRPDGRGAISEAECKDPAALCATKPCSSNETCAVNMNTTIPSAFCQCNANYQRVGLYCLLMSDVRCQGYCKNNGVCEYTDAPRCTCTEAYEGAQCDVRKAAEKLADSAADIAIPVGIAAGGLLLLLILLAVFCLCWHLSKRRNQPRKPYTELNGERLDKASLHSYPAYGQTPLYAGSQRGTLMLASYPEAMYDNRAYRMEDIDHHSNLGSSAVYQA
ncbi:uncharacterized protein LOC127852603 [Dreissena polymorpha]|uniref:uncharacterized protein LOC127852603 n=1 Tax=Dreissena polymorpha TaxID=45954 RepID=UPI002263D219|nr:uncharacterized protein LOC127852603 [Dreissena polymorpha]